MRKVQLRMRMARVIRRMLVLFLPWALEETVSIMVSFCSCSSLITCSWILTLPTPDNQHKVRLSVYVPMLDSNRTD